MIWDSETDEFLCVINDDRHPLKIDIETLLKDVPKTTDSLYSPSRYKTIYL